METVALQRNTTGLIDRLFNELDLLQQRKITPTRARASAALGEVIVSAAQLAVTHHRLKPKRNGCVRAAPLGTAIVPLLIEGESKRIPEVPKKKRRR